MKRILIKGGQALEGEVTISGAKNSTVALIPAAIMGRGQVVLESVPDISDVAALIEILEDFHCQVSYDGYRLEIDATDMKNIPMPEGKIQSLRASYYFMGALLARYGEGVVGLPGGCSIGPRPIDLHIKGFEALGAIVEHHDGAIHFKTPHGLHGADIYMDVVSVGATINVMLAATMAEGETVIENAAREPEIIDVVSLLNKMGAKIRGAGTSTIRIEGVPHLEGATHQIIPDRIEAGTFLTAAAAVGHGVTVKNVIFEHIESFVSKMGEMGVAMEVREDEIFVQPAERRLQMVNIKTMPYPGFATDLQQPILPLLLTAYGQGTIVDTIYPKRIKHIPELRRMGARVGVVKDQIHVEGPNQLKAAEVTASDLRAGASLVNAALLAEGTTTIYGVDHILRGYDKISEKLTRLGASIELIDA